MGRISPGPTTWPPGAERRLVPAKSNLKPPTPHISARSRWVADTNSPPSGRAVGEGQRLTSDAPHNGGRHPPPGTPFRHPHSEQRRPARAHTLGPVLGPHARGDCSRDTRVAEPRLPAPENGRPGEVQRPTPEAPHNGRKHPPQGRPSATPTASNTGPQGRTLWGRCWVPTPAPTATGTHGSQNPGCPLQWAGSRRGERRLTSDAPHNGARHPPPGTPFRHPHSEQRRPARVHAVGPVLSPHARADRTQDTRVAEPWLPAQEDGRPGEGQRLTPDVSHNGGRPPLPGTAPHHPRGTQPPQGMRAKGTVLGPHTHTPAPTARGWRSPTACPVGGQSGRDSA